MTDERTKYHYVLTIQQTRDIEPDPPLFPEMLTITRGKPQVTTQHTAAGTVIPEDGMTRMELFRFLLNQTRDAQDMPGAVTLFWSLEPDQL